MRSAMIIAAFVAAGLLMGAAHAQEGEAAPEKSLSRRRILSRLERRTNLGEIKVRDDRIPVHVVIDREVREPSKKTSENRSHR